MMATRSQLFSTSLRMWLERKTVAPSATASRRMRKNVCWTSGSSPAVGSSRTSRSGRCWSAMTSPTFCLLPLEYSLNRRVGSRSQSLDERGLVGGVDAAAEVGEVLERLGAGQPVVERELARQVADPSVDGHRVDGGLDAEDAGDARCRPDEVEQGPDRRGLAGAVGPQEAEDLALLDAQVHVDDPAVRAVRLGQPLGVDDRGHARLLLRRTRRAGMGVDELERAGGQPDDPLDRLAVGGQYRSTASTGTRPSRQSRASWPTASVDPVKRAIRIDAASSAEVRLEGALGGALAEDAREHRCRSGA